MVKACKVKMSGVKMSKMKTSEIKTDETKMSEVKMSEVKVRYGKNKNQGTVLKRLYPDIFCGFNVRSFYDSSCFERNPAAVCMSFDSSSLPTLEAVSPSGMRDTTLPVMSPSVIIGITAETKYPLS